MNISNHEGYGIWWGPNDPNNRSGKLETNPKRLERAEFQAALIALEQAKKRGIRSLVVNTDCEFIISTANNLGEFKHLGICNGDRAALEALDKATQGLTVVFKKERAKVGVKGNDAACQLARESIQD